VRGRSLNNRFFCGTLTEILSVVSTKCFVGVSTECVGRASTECLWAELQRNELVELQTRVLSGLR